jgi:hypothetical protein
MSKAEGQDEKAQHLQKCKKGYFIARKLTAKRSWNEEFDSLSPEEQEAFLAFVKKKRARRPKGTSPEIHVNQPKKPYSSWQTFCAMKHDDYIAAKKKHEQTNPDEPFPVELKWCKPLWTTEPRRAEIEKKAREEAAAYAKAMDAFFANNPDLEDPRKRPKKKRDPVAPKVVKKKPAAPKATATKKVKAETSKQKVLARESPAKEAADESEEDADLEF